MTERASPAVYRIGDCLLDLERGTLERDGALIPIRAKTWALLAHLTASAGRVVPKDELLDRVWPDVIVTEDSLTQTVRDLRRALCDDRQQILRTVARRGYLLAADAVEPAAAAPRAAPIRRRAWPSSPSPARTRTISPCLTASPRKSRTASRGFARSR